MNLEEIMAKSRKKSLEARKRKQSNFYRTPAYPDKLVQLFNSKFKEHEYGTPPLVIKDVKKLLFGFIKVMRNNNKEEIEIYRIIEKVVEYWDILKTKKHVTLKNRIKMTLGDRPSLHEFLICRESVLASIEKIEVLEEMVQVEATPDEECEVAVAHIRFEPTEEEMEAEMLREREKYE